MVPNLSSSSKRQARWINVVRPASKSCPPPLSAASNQVAQIGKKSRNRQGKLAIRQQLGNFAVMDDAQAGRWEKAIAALHALHIYGAAALASFGFVVARWLRFEPGPWAGLWFAGALFAYNIDRLARDPADAINVPRRVGQFARLRKISAALAAAALLALIVIPMLQRDWLLLALVTAGALFCAAYSVAIMGPQTQGYSTAEDIPRSHRRDRQPARAAVVATRASRKCNRVRLRTRRSVVLDFFNAPPPFFWEKRGAPHKKNNPPPPPAGGGGKTPAVRLVCFGPPWGFGGGWGRSLPPPSSARFWGLSPRGGERGKIEII